MATKKQTQMKLTGKKERAWYFWSNYFFLEIECEYFNNRKNLVILGLNKYNKRVKQTIGKDGRINVEKACQIRGCKRTLARDEGGSKLDFCNHHIKPDQSTPKPKRARVDSPLQLESDYDEEPETEPVFSSKKKNQTGKTKKKCFK